MKEFIKGALGAAVAIIAIGALVWVLV